MPATDPTVSTDATVLTVLACRGCCCGNPQRLPSVDHDAGLAALEAAVAEHGSARVRVVGCLGECSSKNVVVVIRRGDVRRTRWFGSTHQPAVGDALHRWIAGGAEDEPLEPALDAVAFERGLGCTIDQLPAPTRRPAPHPT